MIAQKSSANIIAIDIDENAVIQAKQNVLESKFASQINIQLSSFQTFANSSTVKFNLIVRRHPPNFAFYYLRPTHILFLMLF